MARLFLPALAAAIAVGIGGCAPPELYHWGRYEDLVYDLYARPGKADPTTQITMLTEDIAQADAAGRKVPPGVHAHLGYLHYLQGNLGNARGEFETERALYPESARFMAHLLARLDSR